MTKAEIDKYRQEYRQANISPRYSGWAHLSLTGLSCGAVIVGSILMVKDITTWEWLVVPITFFYANLVEYYGHKGPMHKKTRFLEIIFRRHAVEHHSFFTREHTTFDDSQDFKAVLFPPIMLLFFFGCFATPVWGIIQYTLSDNVAYLFVLTAVAYFLNYEIMHFLYHVDEDNWAAKLPFISHLRRHHTIHHDRELMSHYNFNITYPLCDWLFSTLYKEE